MEWNRARLRTGGQRIEKGPRHVAGAVENQIVPKSGNRLSFLSRTHDSKTMTRKAIAAKSHEREAVHGKNLRLKLETVYHDRLQNAS